MADERSGLEGLLEAAADHGCCEDAVAALLRRAAGAIGEGRRAMRVAIGLIALNTPFDVSCDSVTSETADGLDEARSRLRAVLAKLEGGSADGDKDQA